MPETLDFQNSIPTVKGRINPLPNKVKPTDSWYSSLFYRGITIFKTSPFLEVGSFEEI